MSNVICITGTFEVSERVKQMIQNDTTSFVGNPPANYKKIEVIQDWIAGKANDLANLPVEDYPTTAMDLDVSIVTAEVLYETGDGSDVFELNHAGLIKLAGIIDDCPDVIVVGDNVTRLLIAAGEMVTLHNLKAAEVKLESGDKALPPVICVEAYKVIQSMSRNSVLVVSPAAFLSHGHAGVAARLLPETMGRIQAVASKLRPEAQTSVSDAIATLLL